MRWILRLAGTLGNTGALTNAARACDEHRRALASLDARLASLASVGDDRLRRSA